MCAVLQISRSTYYYECKQKPAEQELVKSIQEIFRLIRNNYGTRKIKVELAKEGKIVSRRRIGRIMKQEGLVSNYTIAQFNPHVPKCNEDAIENILARNFDNQPKHQVVVSDLTYVRVSKNWNYICVLIDLFNREIIGYSAGANKDSNLVMQAFLKVKMSLKEIQVFHTDRGNEFKNKEIHKTLKAFEIERSLSMKGCSYDTAVAEATYKIIKTEFIKHRTFASLEQLQLELADYVNWFNNHRIHSSLNYLTPREFEKNTLKKVV